MTQHRVVMLRVHERERTGRGTRLVIAAASLVALVGVMTPVVAGLPPGWEQLSTPDRIEVAERTGMIDRVTANRYLARAIGQPGRLPGRFRGSAPWRGTEVILRLNDALESIPDGAAADEIRAIIDPTTPLGMASIGAGMCGGSTLPLPDTIESPHFYIEYSFALLLATPDGLHIDDYVASLEGAWVKETDAFGWAAPPIAPAPAPGGKYHVRIDLLSPGLYGYVSPGGTHAGTVGNNPNTGWNDGDASASCMVLNADYSQINFPSPPQASLDATTAHEFNHSIQFGLGALSGSNRPDGAFIEGGATWMEDEVYDAANDNYLYLWPDFTESMGQYNASHYSYWITFRGLTERYGSGVAGGAEQVMQDFWEATSRNTGNNLTALQAALANKGTTLADAFHRYAIAVKFNRACGGGYIQPTCLEEGAGYVAAAGATTVHGTISSVGGSFGGSIADNYAIGWIGLGVSGSRVIRLANTSTGGQLRGSIVCDTGSALGITGLPTVVGAGSSTQVAVNLSGCSAAVLVVTNQSQTAPNPTSSTSRSFAASVLS